MRDQSGFTLIELLTSITIIGALAGISMLTYREYRGRAYDTTALQAIHDAQAAMEASRSNNEGGVGDWYMVWTDAGGNLQGDVDDLVPGFKIGSNMQVTAWRSGLCENNTWCPDTVMCCVASAVMARHCDSKNAYQTLIWNDGTITSFDWPNWGC